MGIDRLMTGRQINRRNARLVCGKILILAVVLACPALANDNLHTTYLWHVHQPIYWPDRSPYVAIDRYENAWDTIRLQDGGRQHPNPEVLRNIFGLDDRKAAYQTGLRNSLATVNVGDFALRNHGAQVSYSGALMENVQSLGVAGQLGYGSTWYSGNQEARGWTTSGGKPRMDLVNFTYHHALAPLLSDETLEMELRIHKRHMELIWGTTPPVSRGYFPTETCFATRMIPILRRVGIDWSIVANSHLSRSCADFPLVIGSGGENCDIPNKADQLNPAQGATNYKRLHIDRGMSPAAAMPFAFQVHYARHVDPNTGEESKFIIVPSDQALGWKDSYSTWDLGLMDDLDGRNDPNKPALVMFAHDGDNAWSGGYSYYQEWVPNFATQAKNRGYEPATVEQFLADHPPDPNDVVHIEDGGWVYADSDFGSPIMINWHWPPSYSSGGKNVVDPSIGVSDKADNWRVIIATENRVKTAQQVQNSLTGYTNRIDQIRDPGSFGGTPHAVELGWHYYLGGLDSGFVYFGCHDDECHRAVVAQSNAVRNVDAIIAANPTADATPPTVFIPQRHPWNPGGQNFGVQYSYTLTNIPNTDFFVWTYAYDVSGITNVNLKFRLSAAPPTNDASKVYAGGTWTTSNMTQRVVAPVIGVTPQYIANYHWTKVTGMPGDTYVDYYVSATDSRGNTYKSPIQHVYVSTPSTNGGGGSTNGCSGRVCVSPVPLVAGNSATITFTPAGGPLAGASQVYIHLGWNIWNPVVSPDAAMTAVSNTWRYVVTIPGNATQLDCVFNNGAGTWDNNSGADWHFTVTSTPQPPPTPGNVTATTMSSTQISVNWSAASGATGYIVRRDGSQIATTSTTSYTDGGLAFGSNYCYSVAATNSVGISPESSPVCAMIAGPPTPQNLTATAVATNQINLVWSASAGASGYIIRRDGNPIATTASTNYNNFGLAPGTQYCYTIAATNAIGSSLFSPPVCATTMAPSLDAPFVLNGSVSNYPGYLLSAPGMTLYAAVRGTTLYVATWSPGTNGPNDHFVLVSDQILGSPTTASPWAKTGTIGIPANKVMLTAESQGTYAGWQNLNGSTATASNQSIKAPTSTGQLQGVISLTQAFGAMPSTLYLSAAAYTTTNGGFLVAQAPAGNGNGNIEPGEFLALPITALLDGNSDGLLDRLDPERDFVVTNVQPLPANGFSVTWASVPGRTYLLIYRDDMAEGWQDLPGAQYTAASGQLTLSHTDTTAGEQRFYKVRLVEP